MAAAQRLALPASSIAWRDFSAAAEPELRIFESSLMAPRDAQRARLWWILRANTDTQFGLEHGFGSMQSIHDFQTRVPVSDWSRICRWVDRAKSGEERVLTAEYPVHFERTSGSGEQHKDVPYTNALLREFQSALVVWLATLVRDCPGIAGPSYWSISPDNSPPEQTAAGVTVGSASDASYLEGSPAEKLLPTVVGSIAPGTNPGEWQLEALRVMAAEPELRMLSVWSPTFLLSLLDVLLDGARTEQSLGALKETLPVDRYKALSAAIEYQDFTGLWPQLQVISCWADGPSAVYAARLESLFPGSRLVPKGLFATEGVVSISWGTTSARPVAITSHFVEFLDQSGLPRLVDELAVGEQYRPLLTTSGGLYRYCLGDLIEVTEFIERTPCIRFIGRDDHRSDLVGEKLDERIVSRALSAAALPGPAILIPISKARPPRYLLAMESAPDMAAQLVETELCRVHHYAIARKNGQLAAVSSCRVSSLSDLLHESWQATGRRSGDAKPVSLIASAEHAESLVQLLRDRAKETEQ
jgi:hypothetical protein